MSAIENTRSRQSSQRTLRWITCAFCVIAAVSFVAQFPLVLRWNVGSPWIWIAPACLALSTSTALVFTVLDVVARVKDTFNRHQQLPVRTTLWRLAVQIGVAVIPLAALSATLLLAAPWLKGINW